MKFQENPSSGSRVVPREQMDGWTGGREDMAKLIDAFRNFPNMPKNYSYIRVSTDPPISNPVYREPNLLVIMNSLTCSARSVKFSHHYSDKLFIIPLIITV